MTNPFALTLAAWLLTLTGQAPLSSWTPLFKDIALMFANSIADFIMGAIL